MKRIAAILVLAAALGGCTTVRYNLDSHEVRYWSVMQKKSLDVTEEVEPATGRKTLSVRFSTDCDPLVQALQEVGALASKAASAAK
jgi:hypothetical protein